MGAKRNSQIPPWAGRANFMLTKRINPSFSQEEFLRIKQAAKMANRSSMSNWVRNVVLQHLGPIENVISDRGDQQTELFHAKKQSRKRG